MISFFSKKKGCVQFDPDGFMPFEYKSLKELSYIICNYTWSNSIFANNYRLGANFLHSDLCVLDVDNDKPHIPVCSIEDIKRQFEGTKLIIGTTKNHLQSKKGLPPRERFRVIIPWKTRIEKREQYELTMRNLMKICDFLDKNCVDAARQWHPCKQIIYYQDGDPLEPSFVNVARYSASQKTFEQNRKKMMGLSKKVEDFLERGVTFGEGRNYSVFISALNLLKVGLTINEVIDMISGSPFDRTDFNDHELQNAVASAYKRL